MQIKFLKIILFCFILSDSQIGFATDDDSSLNQTSSISPIFFEEGLPFRVEIELADFILPKGLQSYVMGTYQGKWLLLAGRTNGLHGFDNGSNNFLPQEQNKVVYVVDPVRKKIFSRSLTGRHSGLTLKQIDLLSVTNAQYYQSNHTLYMTGGYGIDSSTRDFSTKDALTAINVPGLIHWVVHPFDHETAAQHIRQIFDPVFQITGGYMTQIENGPTLLVFGQNFQDAYTPNSNGEYSQQIRRFYILDDGRVLSTLVLDPSPEQPDSNYRRRDLNVVPIIHSKCGYPVARLLALSGVFTLEGGIWTIPVKINSWGFPSMAPPSAPFAFKQGMNNYSCPTLGLYSKRSGNMYTILFGGISFGYFENGEFQTDQEIPFINQVTTIKLDPSGHYQQYLMNAEYPVILSKQSNPGNRLLFGASAQLILNEKLPTYKNDVLKLDKIDKRIVVGHIVGGIQSTLPNTTNRSDTAASPYIFRVILTPIHNRD